jgi:hypothetical protein
MRSIGHVTAVRVTVLVEFKGSQVVELEDKGASKYTHPGPVSEDDHTYIDTKTNKDMPDSMTCHTSKVKSSGIHLFREPFSV